MRGLRTCGERGVPSRCGLPTTPQLNRRKCFKTEALLRVDGTSMACAYAADGAYSCSRADARNDGNLPLLPHPTLVRERFFDQQVMFCPIDTQKGSPSRWNAMPVTTVSGRSGLAVMDQLTFTCSDGVAGGASGMTDTFGGTGGVPWPEGPVQAIGPPGGRGIGRIVVRRTADGNHVRSLAFFGPGGEALGVRGVVDPADADMPVDAASVVECGEPAKGMAANRAGSLGHLITGVRIANNPTDPAILADAPLAAGYGEDARAPPASTGGYIDSVEVQCGNVTDWIGVGGVVTPSH